MTKEEIEKRIEHCELMEMAHREVGNTKSANRFNNEKYKWEKLLSELNPKNDEELRTYKIGYYSLRQALIDIREIINNCSDNLDDIMCYDIDKYKKLNILQIIDKVLGDVDNDG